ncbi:hypothetical protein [Vibrio sp. OPT10]|uniref:hypothetical protein n=1 Tax=Vibrio sp. OPT10 TaxID=2778640 RepID=UPI00187F6D38|nr:hypothetical protein [Vibrio sp. OPT10]MBE8607990.1 hypothetical protein [Vibrio sp. OPT10]
MSFARRLEFGNYTLKFGDEKVLLDMFDEVVMPSFHEMKYIKSHGTNTQYFFLDTELIVLDDYPFNPVLGITGRIVKNTKLRRDQIFKEGDLIADRDEMESAPSSTFLLILNNHRLILTREVPGAPTVQNFQSTSQYCLMQAYNAFIEREYQNANKERHENTEIKRVTKKQLKEKNPSPFLRITPLPDKESLDDFIGRFKTINKLSIKLLPTNREEIDNDDFWATVNFGREEMGGDSTAKVEFTNRKTGLNNDQVINKTTTATALGNSTVNLAGVDEFGDSLKGNNDNFNLSIELEDISRDVKEAATTKFKLFNGLGNSGAISMPVVPGEALTAIKTLFGRFR